MMVYLYEYLKVDCPWFSDVIDTGMGVNYVCINLLMVIAFNISAILPETDRYTYSPCALKVVTFMDAKCSTDMMGPIAQQ